MFSLALYPQANATFIPLRIDTNLLHVVLGCVVLSAIFYFIVYPVFLSPLARIPNAHWSSPISQVWMHWRRYTGREVSTTNEAFQRKGPVVRLGPNEVAVNVIQGGVRTAHGHGWENFDKTQWYDFFVNHGSRNTFSSRGEEHSVRRKRVTSVYAKSFIQSSRHVQAIVANLVQGRLLPLIHKSAESNTPVDILPVNFAYGVDFVAAFVFGLRQGTNFIQDAVYRHQWLEEYKKSHPSEYMFWLLEHPDLTRWLRNIGIYVVPKWYTQADEDFDKWGLQMIDSTEKLIQDGLVEERTVSGDMPIVYNQLKEAIASELKLEDRARFCPSPEQRLELASECLDQLVATRDTFGVAFSFVLLEISRHPYSQARLRSELRSITNPLTYPNVNPATPLPTSKSLEDLPYMHAILKESIRLRGTQPTPNPRFTPRNTTTTLGPYSNIPSGVRVSAFAWCLHRNEEIFPDPEVWIPERWLDLSKEEVERKEKWFWAFGSGSRMCLGRNLAMEMMRFALAAIYTNFQTSVVGEETFCREGKFVTGSSGDELKIRFTRVS